MQGHRASENKGCAAFTLMELIVVMVILAIAAALIVPQAIGTGDLAVIAAGQMVAADLEYAQNTAITSQAPVIVTFNASGNSYTLSNASGDLIHPMTKSAYAISFASQSGLSEVDLVSVSFGETPVVTFDELGAPDNAGTVVLQSGPHVYQVSVAPVTGRVTVTGSGS